MSLKADAWLVLPVKDTPVWLLFNVQVLWMG